MADRAYVVSGYLTISVVKTIRAKDKRAARKKAESLAVPSLCYQCSSAGEDEDDTWELNGFDDPPNDCVRNVDVLRG
jgi:hypothetical protein